MLCSSIRNAARFAGQVFLGSCGALVCTSLAAAQAASLEFRVAFNGALGGPMVISDNDGNDTLGAPGNVGFTLFFPQGDATKTLLAGLTITGTKIPGVNGRRIVVTAIDGLANAGAFPAMAGTIDIYACYRFNGPGLTVPAPNVFTRAAVGTLENNVDGSIDLAQVRVNAGPNGNCALAPGDPGAFVQGIGPGGFSPTPFFHAQTYPLSLVPCVDISTVTRLTVFRNGDEIVLPGSVEASVVAVSSCATGGGGGSIPPAGTGGGTWPNVLPPSVFSSTASISTPPGVNAITRVVLHGLQHTYVGDLQVVLTDPAGTQHNLLHRPGFPGNGGFGHACGLQAGDYELYEDTGVQIEAGCGAGLAPGIYAQSFGNWPSGALAIFNTPLSNIPVFAGTTNNWTLAILDWAGGDVGSLSGWDLCFDPGAGLTSYCTAGVTTNGCTPAMQSASQPSVSFAQPCVISASGVEGQKQGVLFFGLMPTAFPWAPGSSSFLCIKAPTQRMPLQNSGGSSGACDGALVQDWNAYQMAHPGGLGFFLSAGSHVYCQGWFRDPAAVKTTNLTGALDMTVEP